MKKTLLMAALALASAAATLDNASAQVAGSTARSVTLTEVQELALGWSVKKSLLGKVVYNAAGDKVGAVQDLIISPDKSLSYLIIAAGGFIGLGRHDVAVPVGQVQDLGGKLVLAGATRDSIKAMPAFDYASDDSRREAFAARADKDIAAARLKLADVEKKTSAATADAKLKLDAQVVSLKQELSVVEAKLADLRKASAAKWHSFEADVIAATARLRKAIDSAAS